MTRRFRKALLCLLLLPTLMGHADPVPAQQKGENLMTALREAREAGVRKGLQELIEVRGQS